MDIGASHYIKTLVLVLLLCVLSQSNAQCTANFTYTLLPNGLVHFSNTSAIPSAGQTNYHWDFGDGSTSWVSPYFLSAHMYPNGTYTIVFTITNSLTTCTDSINKVITITTSSCNFNLIPAFSYTFNNSLSASFVSTSSGTTSNTTYTWRFGDGQTGSGLSTSHTYTANSSYNVWLILDDGFCTDTIYKFISPATFVDLLNNYDHKLEYKISPNPSQGELSIKIKGFLDSKPELHLINLLGEIIFTTELEGSNGEFFQYMSVEGIENGVYFVLIRNSKSIYTHKLILNK